ncbi:MAG: hypothetical protein Q9216_002680 [Gyalolechia sp. 2 TL-2023]
MFEIVTHLTGFDPPSRLGGVTRRSEPGAGVGDSRLRSPNFKRQLRLSDDEGTPATTRKGSLTLRQRRLLKADDSKHVRGQYELSSDDPGRSQSASPRIAFSSRSHHQSGKLGMKAAPLNRAQRRANAFGHKENPPDGYKALQFASPKQQYQSRDRSHDEQMVSPDHPRSRRQVEFSKIAAAKNSDGRRWVSAPTREEETSPSLAERPQRKSHAPLAIPYTTPASEFLYGHSVVTAALKGSRRKFYKVYLYHGETAEVRGQDRQVRKLALAANVEVTRVGSDWLRLMDKMSGGRPHNGYILEASPLAKLPVTALHSVPNPQSTFKVTIGHQSQEEEAVNGSNPAVRYGTGYRRYPFLLLLDGIRDPGNMGAIFRSAHFLGADGIIICNRNAAGLTPVTLKAAAGAAESLPIFSVDQPSSFIDSCQQNGWKFYAAVSPSSSDSENTTGRSEGEGLRWNIQKKADCFLGIEAQRVGNGDLDSLNVSVAAALLCQAFLKKPTAGESDKPKHQGNLNVAPAGGRKQGDGHPALVEEGSKDRGTEEPAGLDVAAIGQRLF